MQQNQPLAKVESRFKAKVNRPELFTTAEVITGFEHKPVAVILDAAPAIIQTDYHWGLVPHWSSELSFAKHTLNARIETLHEKPSYKDVVTNRCLIIASAFYEWRWEDEKGTKKTQFTIYSQDDELFAMAGLYTTALVANQPYHSFTMVTTQATDIMTYIHNTKNRMPIVLQKGAEAAWLDASIPVEQFKHNYQAKLVGF